MPSRLLCLPLSPVRRQAYRGGHANRPAHTLKAGAGKQRHTDHLLRHHPCCPPAITLTTARVYGGCVGIRSDVRRYNCTRPYCLLVKTICGYFLFCRGRACHRPAGARMQTFAPTIYDAINQTFSSTSGRCPRHWLPERGRLPREVFFHLFRCAPGQGFRGSTSASISSRLRPKAGSAYAGNHVVGLALLLDDGRCGHSVLTQTLVQPPDGRRPSCQPSS